MTAKKQLRIIVAALLVIGLGVAAYKHLALGFPLGPGARETVWTAQARISLRADGDPVKVRLNLPDNTGSLLVVDQGATAAGFGFHVEKEADLRTGVWQARAPRGEATLFYKARVYRGNGLFAGKMADTPDSPEKPVLPEAQADAADTILKEAWTFSADASGLAVQLAQVFGEETPSPAVVALLGDTVTSRKRAETIVALLHAADVPAHLLRGLYLDEAERSSTLTSLVEFWDGDSWEVLDPVTGALGMPEYFLPWQRAGEALFEVEGAGESDIRFAVITDRLAARSVALQYAQNAGSALIDFSIYSLPIDVQNTFATLLLIPIGALVVVILRNLVGLQTSGTFMPILIALVFVQTELLTGLVLFLVIVGIGLVIRGYLSSLNLLLVPRIAAVLIVVITLYIALSVAGFKMGITAALSVTFFPMIIISWTIERMSVLAEEEEMRDVLIQGGGSLLTAVIAYLVMTERHVSYWVFAYPELLLVVLAVILVIGQYTGYRLSELRRFEPLSREQS